VRHSECLLRAPRRPARPARALAAAIASSAVLCVASPAGAQDATTTSSGPAGATSTTQIEGPSVRGRIRHDGEPVAGVRISVNRQDGRVGEARTDGDGHWEVPLPADGRYDVTIDTGTLPEGVALRNPDRGTLTVSVRPAQHRPVLFPLGERVSTKSDRVEVLGRLLAIGVRVGLLVAMAAIGLSLIFGVTGLVNFAHGELVTFGALIAFFLNASTGGPGLHVVLAGALAVVAGALAGFAFERGMFAPLRRRKTEGVSLIVFTIGISIVLRNVYLIVFGGAPRPLRGYTIQQAFSVGPVALPPRDWVISLMGIIVLVAAGLLVQRTLIGVGMRAVADDRDLAAASGVDVERVILATWIVGGALAALGGVLLGVTEQVAWNMGLDLLLLMFAAVIVGGLGTAYGAMLGGLLVGITSQMSTYWIPVEFKNAVALAALIVVLIVRPQGILGSRERVG